jgi:type I restriction enzyme M protein
MDQVFIPRFSDNFENSIHKIVQQAYTLRLDSSNKLQEAEQLLTASLGLSKLKFPEPLSYICQSRDVFKAERLDAEYFAPSYDLAYQTVSSRFKSITLGELGFVLKGVTVSYYENGDIPIIRSGDLSDITLDDKFFYSKREEPIFYLKRGDILISSIGFGSIGKIQVFDKKGDYGTVSEVTVVRQKIMNPYFLCEFLRSKFGQMQIERYITGATGQLHLYPKDVAKIWVPLLEGKEQDNFESLTKSSEEMKNRAALFLKHAIRSVEIAIEDSEKAAIQYLTEKTQV